MRAADGPYAPGLMLSASHLQTSMGGKYFSPVLQMETYIQRDLCVAKREREKSGP